MAFRSSDSASEQGGDGIVTVTAPTGITDGDILVLVAHTYGGDPAGCTGFTPVASREVTGDDTLVLFWKRAASESGDYNVVYSGGNDCEAWIGCYSGRLASGNPVDVYSDTLYQTSNTTVRAAGMTIATANSDIIWGGFCYSDPLTLTKPAAFTLRDSEVGSSVLTCGDLLNQSAGATGNQDGTAGGAVDVYKHAFMVALKPALPVGGGNYVMVVKT